MKNKLMLCLQYLSLYLRLISPVSVCDVRGAMPRYEASTRETVAMVARIEGRQ